MLAAIEHYLSIDEDVLDSGGILLRALISCMIDDLAGIEYGDIGPLARPQKPAVEDVDLGGVSLSHFAHRLLQRKEFLVAGILA